MPARPYRLFESDEFRLFRTPPWRSAQRFMRAELVFVRRQLNDPELQETLSDRLHKVNGSFLLEVLEAAGVTSLRDLTYWSCLATQPDYLFIMHEAIGLDCRHNYNTNATAWAHLMYVLRVEETNRCWPGLPSHALLREKYGNIAKELYERLTQRNTDLGPLSPALRRRYVARRLNLTRWM